MTATDTGLKYDTGKPRLDLVRPEFTEGVAAVLAFGSVKYAAWNWAKGIEYSRLIAALERHIAAFKRGEDIDPESGLPHLDHAACCMMFLSCFQKWGDRTDLDDRYKRGPSAPANLTATEVQERIRMYNTMGRGVLPNCT